MNAHQYEDRRLAALIDLEVLDTEPELIFESLTELAQRTFNVPVALISLVDKDRQWFKACIGLPVTETPRDVAFCNFTIQSSDVLVVLDALAEPRFAQNPLVIAEPGIRFYAGAPMITPDGLRIGTVCLIDFVPRPGFGPAERERLQRLADAVMQGLIMRREAHASARRAAQATQSDERYRLIAENATDIILQYDLEGRIGYASPSMCRLGYSPKDAIGRLASDFGHPDDAALVRRRLQEIVQGIAGGSYDSRVRKANGEWVWVESNPATMYADDGAIIGGVTVLRDITERKATEAALLESEARYRMLADNAIDIVIRYDLQGRMIYVSPSIRRYGREPEELVGLKIGDAVKASYRHRVLQRLTDTLAGKPDEPEEWLGDAAGRGIWIEGQFSAMRDADGAIVGALLTLRDVEARKTAEAALQEVNAELTRVARVSALGAFSASLAHEINQPIAGMVANSQTALAWLDRDPPNLQKVEEAIRRSERDAQRVSDIVERLRAMVTRETPTLADFDLNDAVREVLALIQPELQRWSIAAAIDLSEDPLWVRGDRILLQQVLMNLILNAIEAMHAARAAERLLMVRSATGAEGQVRIEVEDRGSGIEPGAADRMFDILFSTKQGGSGLGLSISQSIIESHGGRIWAEPAEPRGAILAFQIPGAGRDAAG